MEGSAGNFSQLQHLLQLSYSENSDDQQKAAIDMVRLVEGTVFPAVSFGPISHALCRLVPSSNRTVASYSARALKLLILDDALRSQAIVAGVPSVVCGAIKQWEDEVLCLRELLGALQTLTWDKACVKGVLQADILSSVIDFTQAPDQEVSVLAMATLANVLSYSDTLLLTDTVLVETLATSLPLIMDSLRPFPSSASSSSQHSDSLSRNQSKRHTSQDSLNQSPSTGPQRFYAIASLANASCHPRLAEVIKVNGGLQLARDLERQSLANLHILGSRVVDCAQAMLYRLSDRREGDAKAACLKFKFKWGVRPVVELSLATFKQHSGALVLCFGLWLLVILYSFSPLLFG